MDLNFLRSHEEDSGQDTAIHLGYRDGEDQHPGENTCEGVDNSQHRVTQKQPNVGTDPTLQKHTRDVEISLQIVQRGIQVPKTFLPSALMVFWEADLGRGPQQEEEKIPGVVHSPQHPALVELSHSLSALQWTF